MRTLQRVLREEDELDMDLPRIELKEDAHTFSAVVLAFMAGTLSR
jgi:hypothetical protein